MRLVLVLLVLINVACADSKGIWVEGVGETEVKPDIVNLSFTVSTLDKSASKAQQQNAKMSDAVVSKVKSFGVAGKDIQSSGFHVNPEYDYQSRERVLKGHRVQHSYAVVLRDTKKLGELLDALTSVGADSVAIGGIGFGLSEPEPLRMKALELAVTHAKEKAEVLARSAKKTLGKVVAIEELTGGHAVPMVRTEMMKSAAASPATNIETGEVGVSARVKVHFELE